MSNFNYFSISQNPVIAKQEIQQVEIIKPVSITDSSLAVISIFISGLALLVSSVSCIIYWNNHRIQKNDLKIQENNLKTQQNDLKIQENNLKIQKLTLVNDLNNDYHRLAGEYKNLQLQSQPSGSNELPDEFYIRYWTQRRHEFSLYIDEVLDDKFYLEWIQALYNNYKSEDRELPLLGITGKKYQEGYNKAKEILKKNKNKDSLTYEFFKFVDQIFKDEEPPEKTLETLKMNLIGK